MKEYIEKIWEYHYLHRHFLESFIEGQRSFYDELYQGEDYIVFIPQK